MNTICCHIPGTILPSITGSERMASSELPYMGKPVAVSPRLIMIAGNACGSDFFHGFPKVPRYPGLKLYGSDCVC
ncbi:MAG: hypothetical protein P8013_03035 [Candidatus Sulfobium sp.]